MKHNLFILMILFACNEKSSNISNSSMPNYFLKTELHHYSGFYREFDILKRQGVGKLKGDTLYVPFLGVKDSNDSIIDVTLFSKQIKTSYQIPKDDRICYKFHDINDGPRHVFTKIFSDKIISYGYDNTMKELEEIGMDSVFLEDIVPSEIKIIKRDSIYSFYFGKCLTISKVNVNQFRVPSHDVEKYWIKPFSANLKAACRDKTFLIEDSRILKAEGFHYWYQHYGMQ